MLDRAKLITPQQLSEHWQVPVKTIYRLVSEGKLRVVRLPHSRLLRFDPEKLGYTPEELEQQSEGDLQRLQKELLRVVKGQGKQAIKVVRQ